MKSSTIIKSALAAGTFAVAGVASASADTITVKSGDTLNKIAAANGTTVAELAQANGITNTNLIFIGQQLKTQGSSTPATQAVAPTATPNNATGTYSVKAGDTLYRIAASNGVSIADLVAANNIQNVNYISVGQVLKLSGNATQPATSTAPVAQQAAPAATPAPATTTPAPAKQAVVPTSNNTPAPVVNSAAQALVDSLNSKRAALGLNPVTLDAGLSARAQARAQNAVANGGLPTNHFQTNGEVVAIGWGIGQVINAWYNETNMITTGTPGHRLWVANARATSVGFGIVGGTIVAESNVGQY